VSNKAKPDGSEKLDPLSAEQKLAIHSTTKKQIAGYAAVFGVANILAVAIGACGPPPVRWSV